MSQLTHQAAGVRIDVAPPPRWIKDRVESRLVGATLVPQGWLNSYAINFYHDGTEGLRQHYDDNTRYARIHTALTRSTHTHSTHRCY